MTLPLPVFRSQGHRQHKGEGVCPPSVTVEQIPRTKQGEMQTHKKSNQAKVRTRGGLAEGVKSLPSYPRLSEPSAKPAPH
eukprot:2667484-Amphidinium_carterae.1